MKKILIFILFCLFLSCEENIINENEKIEKIKVNLSITNNEVNPLYHIYVKNNSSYKKSLSYDLTNSNELFLECERGNYNLYILSLIDKSATAKYANKIYYSEESLFENKIITVELTEVYPETSIIIYNNLPRLIINFQKYENLFSISSLSLKQGTDKVKSLSFNYDAANKYYYADITLYQNGEWLLNTSFSVKAAAQDEKKLSDDNIILSTTAFTNITLGSFNFIK